MNLLCAPRINCGGGTDGWTNGQSSRSQVGLSGRWSGAEDSPPKSVPPIPGLASDAKSSFAPRAHAPSYKEQNKTPLRNIWPGIMMEVRAAMSEGMGEIEWEGERLPLQQTEPLSSLWLKEHRAPKFLPWNLAVTASLSPAPHQYLEVSFVIWISPQFFSYFTVLGNLE